MQSIPRARRSMLLLNIQRRSFTASSRRQVTLLSLPERADEVKRDDIPSPKRARKTTTLSDLQRSSKHIVGYEEYQINVFNDNVKDNKRQLEISLETAFKQLNISRERRYFRGEDFIRENKLHLPKYQNPYKDEINTLDEIKFIERFKFDLDDYEITQEMLDKQPITISSFTKKLIDDNTPNADSATDIMGINKDIFLAVRSAVTAHSFRMHYDCEFFSMKFYHRDHFLSRIRKSRPSIFFLNKNESRIMPNQFLNQDLKFSDVQKPMKFAVNRSQTRKLLKKLFFEEYSSRDSPRDGLYQISMKIPPRREETQTIIGHMNKAFDAVAQLNEKHLLQECEQAESRIKWKDLNRICKRVGLPSMQPIHINNNNGSSLHNSRRR